MVCARMRECVLVCVVCAHVCVFALCLEVCVVAPQSEFVIGFVNFASIFANHCGCCLSRTQNLP